jgi:hypothetical protein
VGLLLFQPPLRPGFQVSSVHHSRAAFAPRHRSALRTTENSNMQDSLLHTLPRPCIRVAVLLATLLVATICTRAHAADPPLFASSGASVEPWTTFAAEGVDIAVVAEENPIDHERAIKLSYDFRLGSGYAGIRRPVNQPLPPNFTISFDLYSDLPDNNLEIKLVSPDGHDVWWVNRRAFSFPRTWTPLASRKRHFEFAWGPSAGAPLKQVGTIEIVVASSEGGKGTLWLRNIEFRALPAPPADAPRRAIFHEVNNGTITSNVANGENPLSTGAWVHTAGKGLAVHLQNPSEISGLDIQYADGSRPVSLVLESSTDGSAWRPVRIVEASLTPRQFIRLGEFGEPWLRVTPVSMVGTQTAFERITLIPIEHASPTAMQTYIARLAPRGLYPRAFLGEQSYWTVLGLPEGADEALIGEDGAVEVGRRDFTIEPFIEHEGRLITWAQSTITQSLLRDYIPIPTVTRESEGLRLEVTAAACGASDAGDLLIRYRLTNTAAKESVGTLILAARPMQVNPPTQWLNLPGGSANVASLRWEESLLHVNEGQKLARTVVFPPAPSSRGLAAAEDGDGISTGAFRAVSQSFNTLSDGNQAATARIGYDFDLKPGASREWWVSTPITAGQQPSTSPAQLASTAPEELDSQAQRWETHLSKVNIQLPRAHAAITNTARSTLAYILINKDGPGIQPGSRNYERSWIRDGSLTSSALLAFGHTDEVRRFIEWYAPRQFDSGAVPCVVDRRGPDPVPEHDSHGQLIWLIWNYYQHTGDLEFLRAQYPHIKRAATHIQDLRLTRMTGDWTDRNKTRQEPGKPPVSATAFVGLVPESISHEGYSAKPMHSYWDDAFCIRGLFDAVHAAEAVGDSAFATECAGWARSFAQSFEDSVRITAGAHGIDYIPGCVELGDFDPTSTTVLLWPCQVLFGSLKDAADRTFERNWTNFTQRRDQSPAAWKDYTPYELRQVGSYVMLGQPERAYEVLEFHMGYRRPAGWNHWAEVVRPELRTAGFVGDMPHTWCGSDFLNSLRTMFAYERTADDSIVLLAGIPRAWIETEEQIGIRGLVLARGTLDVTLHRERNTLKIEVSGDCRIPPGGVRIKVPKGWEGSTVTIDGKPAGMTGGEVRLDELPRSVELSSTPRQ